MQNQTGTSQQNPLSDLMFDWVTILQSKADGLAAYEKYIADAEAENATECVQLLNRLRQQDIEAVTSVKQHVVMMLNKQSQSEGRQDPSEDQKSYGRPSDDTSVRTHHSDFQPTH